MPATPEAIYVVSTALGFAGAFASEDDARRLLTGAHPGIPFATQRFPLAADQPAEHVWVVPYSGCEAPAIVTNDRERALRVQAGLLRLGWTYEGEIDNWRQPVGVVRDSVRTHLDAQTRALALYAGGAEDAARQLQDSAARDVETLERLMRGPSPDGPLARAIRENELLEIYSCVEVASDAPPAEAAQNGSESVPASG